MEEQPIHDAAATSRSRLARTGNKKIKKVLIVLVIFLLLVGVIFGLQKLSGSKKKVAGEKITPSPTTALFPTDTPMPTEFLSPTLTPPEPTITIAPSVKPTTSPIDPTTKLDRSSLSITVQNGSGETGVGSKGADVLKGFGYRVSSIENADNFDYEQVTIQVKPEKSKFLSLLKKDLGTSYTIGTTNETLSASASADAIVIIGK